MSKKRLPDPMLVVLLGILALVFAALALALTRASTGFPYDWSGVLIAGLICLFAGATLGYLRPARDWRWGFIVASPFLIVLLVSLLFTGIFDKFWTHDFPITVVAVAGACLGVLLGTWWAPVKSREDSSPLDKVS